MYSQRNFGKPLIAAIFLIITTGCGTTFNANALLTIHPSDDSQELIFRNGVTYAETSERNGLTTIVGPVDIISNPPAVSFQTSFRNVSSNRIDIDPSNFSAQNYGFIQRTQWELMSVDEYREFFINSQSSERRQAAAEIIGIAGTTIQRSLLPQTVSSRTSGRIGDDDVSLNSTSNIPNPAIANLGNEIAVREANNQALIDRLNLELDVASNNYLKRHTLEPDEEYVGLIAFKMPENFVECLSLANCDDLYLRGVDLSLEMRRRNSPSNESISLSAQSPDYETFGVYRIELMPTVND